MIIEKTSCYIFEKNISVETIAKLSFQLDEMLELDFIEVDLSSTTEVHSSFIGFLIYLKTEKDKRGQEMSLILSDQLRIIFSRLKLEKFFEPSCLSA